MADIDALKRALVNADKAGDVDAARKLANALKAQMAVGTGNQERIDQAFSAPEAGNGGGELQRDRFGSEMRSRDVTLSERAEDYARSVGLPVDQIKRDWRGVNSFVEGASQAMTFNLSDEIAAGLSTGFGLFGDYGKTLEGERARMAYNQEMAPGANSLGNIGGALALGAGNMRAGLSMIPRVAGRNLAVRSGVGALEGATYGGLYGFGAGEGVEDRAKQAGMGALFGAAVGGAVPVAGAALRAGGEVAANQVLPRIKAVINPEGEAARRVGSAFSRDATMQQGRLRPADELAGFVPGQDVRNFDRGGETVRALTRSVTNQSPESRGVVERVVNDRFSGQTDRFRTVIEKVAGGAVDDIAFQDSMRQAAQRANKPRYDRAYRDGDKLIRTPEMERLMGSEAVASAMRNVATGKGKDRAIAQGFGAFNPGVKVADDGRILFQKASPGSAPTFPNLQFWDSVKRELDDMTGVARRAGRKEEAATLTGITKTLRDELDKQVPSYKAARTGAAQFFDAEDALEAGRKFVFQNRDIRQSMAAMAKMTPQEREAFKVGFAAEFTEKLGQTSDRRNVINQIFSTPNARDKLKAVFGANGAKELESFAKVEAVIDMMRGAMGNSTTARQLVELGLGAGVGYTYSGELSGALVGAALAKGMRIAGVKAEERVLREVAKILLSPDRNALAKSAKSIAKSMKLQKALDQVMLYLEQSGRASGAEAVTSPNYGAKTALPAN